MNVSYQWLSEYIDLGGIEPQELAELLTRGGIEIDGVASRNAGVTKTVVGYVLEKEKHPDADKLNVCKIDAGTGETLQIVCGAPNVAAGQKVPVALVGAKLPGDLQIKRAKLRGVESQGMICSARELGINDKLLPKELQEGILVLPADAEIGTDIADLLGLNDSVLELDLTPNRSDCLSLLGVAYETAALTGRLLTLPEPEKALYPASDKTSDAVRVGIASVEACSHYAMRAVKGVKIGPSPLWLQNRLIAAGIRPISNVVDVTNFVMLEYGQPLHAFDAAKVKGAVNVRFACEGETLVTLDGQERKLEPHMPVIADDERAIALAGVMGGLDTEVTPDTVDILLESARFAGPAVRKTSRQLGLRSEASARFEKGVDPERVLGALDRAAALIAQVAGGLVTEGVAEVRLATPEPAVIELSLDRINRMLGTSLSSLEIKTIWSRLQFQAEPAGEGVWRLTVPTRRGDITRAVDLIEEVARLNGYDRIPTTRIEGPTTTGALTKPQAIRRELRKLLSESGLNEAVTYSVTSAGRAALFAELSGAAGGMRPIPLAMPMSEERSALRATLLPNLLEAAAYNKSRRNASTAAFEIASVYHSAEEKLTTLPAEHQRLAVLLTGNRRSSSWNQAAETYDFYDIKGIVERIALRLGLADALRFEQAKPADFHPGRAAALKLKSESGEQTIGYVGQLHPELQRDFDLGDAYAAEIDLKPLYEAADARIVYRTLPRFPSAERDLAVVVDEGVPGASLAEAAKSAAGEWAESVRVFDVYAGERLGAGKKSVALALVYRHPDRTLTDEEIADAQSSVVRALEQSFSAELRK
ncbi:phenylalanine--tRNA ligase subunit beta [Cohnella sp. JJ-181]|uniref:phenylalanine--tRNA ligase subunit beta n=1 Tax=Cohnella rhizoplanae TaxID=2974897 RepID=UPI0022FF7FE8|nr:phenylalanine--tRNA ligase subunit beta [Cohnella sp. JJ-181]CAI6045825.1 Phenylalanine--tRNA ligase beta subunit [Cohnella sp. JJ-181]